MSNFCHLHRHSEFSPLDGTGNAEHYASRAAELGQSALALTDHATLGGALDHVQACRNHHITPVVGVEVYFRPNRFDRSVDHNWAPHLTLHAVNLKGWHSLLRLTTEAYMTGFYGKPCTDWELLEKYSEGLSCSSACVSSLLNQYILQGDEESALNFIDRMKTIFQGRFWLEIMPHDFDDQRTLNLGLYNLGQQTSTPLIATVDAHYPYKEWAKTQDLVFKLGRGGLKKKRDNEDDPYGDNKTTLYLMSEDEVKDTFAAFHPDLPSHVVDEAVNETVEVVKQTSPYIVSKDLKLPKASESPEHAEAIIREWVEEGIQREIDKRGYEFEERLEEYKERIEWEMDELRSKGVLDYFVIVGDVVRWCKSDRPLPGEEGTKRPIRVALGRGSAAGCLVSYLIGITGIDPIPWELLFERFLNPNRKGLPDIDLDFDSERREEVKEYVALKYGRDHVADIISYQTFGPRAAIEEMGKMLDVPYSDIEDAKSDIGSLDKDLAKLVKKNKKLQLFSDKYPEVWEHCLRVDNMVRAPSKHAAGVVITDNPISDYMPLQVNKGKTKSDPDSIVTAWADRAAFPIISDFGFLKMDFLGVTDLSLHDYICQLVKEQTGEEPNLELPCLWDPDWYEPEVMEAFRKFLTLGIFQFGGPAFRNVIQATQPKSARDLAANNALVRPGAKASAPLYGRRNTGQEETTFWHEFVVPFLSSTHGILLYQEQVMRLVQAIGDFTPGDADDMRKAMSKLYRLPGDEAQKFMEKYRSKWDAGEEKAPIGKALRDEIWQAILAFGDYSFNLSHAASYALQAYQSMHLKVKYPKQFYAALLTYDPKLAADAVREAKEFGVEITPPDINASEMKFTIDGDKLRYGLAAIKNFGSAQALQIIRNRPFESYEDFLKKVPSLQSKISLIKSGAFDSLEDRKKLLANVKVYFEHKYKINMTCGCERILPKIDADTSEYVCRKEGHEGVATGNPVKYDPTITIAEFMQKNLALKKPKPLPDILVEPSKREIAEWEEEMLGVALTIPSAVTEHADFIRERIFTEKEIEEAPDGSEIIIGGEVIRLHKIKTKKGQDMAFLDIRFGPHEWSCTVFPASLNYAEKRIKNSSGAVMIKGKKNNYQGSVSIIPEMIVDIEELVKQEE